MELLASTAGTQEDSPIFAKCVSCSKPITKLEELYPCPGPECGGNVAKRKLYLHGGDDANGSGNFFEIKGIPTRVCELCFLTLENNK